MTDQGVVVWVTGPSDDAVARVAAAIASPLERRRLPCEVLGCGTPGLAALADAGIDRCAAVVAGRLACHGVAVVVAVPSPSRIVRDAARAAIPRLIEVYVAAGGPRADYEAPARPEVQIDLPETELEAAVARTLRTLELLGFLRPDADTSYSAAEEREVIKRLKSFGYM